MWQHNSPSESLSFELLKTFVLLLGDLGRRLDAILGLALSFVGQGAHRLIIVICLLPRLVLRVGYSSERQQSLANTPSRGSLKAHHQDTTYPSAGLKEAIDGAQFLVHLLHQILVCFLGLLAGHFVHLRLHDDLFHNLLVCSASGHVGAEGRVNHPRRDGATRDSPAALTLASRLFGHKSTAKMMLRHHFLVHGLGDNILLVLVTRLVVVQHVPEGL